MKKLSPPTSIPPIPVFKEFDGEDFWLVPGYQRNLPHWRLEGATYFVTFRLADSLPESVVRKWVKEQTAWLHAHDIAMSWQTDDPERFHAALAAVPHGERQAFERDQARRFFIALDRCYGACVLRHAGTGEMVRDALLHFHGERVWTGDFVVMPNHVHVIVQPFPGVKLEDWLYSIKRFTGSRIGRMSEAGTRVPSRGDHPWQTESFDRVIRDQAEWVKTREYIANNPSRLKAGEYVLHRAAWPA